jgi:hypothetical protein
VKVRTVKIRKQEKSKKIVTAGRRRAAVAVEEEPQDHKQLAADLKAVYTMLDSAFMGWAYYSLADMTHFGHGPLLRV